MISYLLFIIFAFFSVSFTFDVAQAEKSLQIEQKEIQSDSALKAKNLEVRIPGFFSCLHEKFKNFIKFVTKIMPMFRYTYGCEQSFSFME